MIGWITLSLSSIPIPCFLCIVLSYCTVPYHTVTYPVQFAFHFFINCPDRERVVLVTEQISVGRCRAGLDRTGQDRTG